MNEGDWRPLTDPPPARETVWLKTEQERLLGWRIYDSLLGRSYFWAWTKAAKLPSKYTSALQRAGMTPVKPLAWKPYVKPRITIPYEPVARREAELLVHRVILTDGTMRGLRKGGLESSWDDSWHTDEKERGAGELIDYEHVHKLKFTPTPRDVQNYEDGIVMSWFLALRSEGKRAWNEGLNDRQKAFVYRAYGFSYHVIGDRVDVTESRARTIYRQAVDRVWDRALGETRPVRRPRREEWDRASAHRE